MFSRCSWLVQSRSSLCLDHPCCNEVPGLPATLLHVLIFSQHCSSPSGSFCFSPPLPLLVLLFLCILDLDFPPLLFYQYFRPIAVYTTNTVASPPIPGTLYLPSLPSPSSAASAPAVMQWCEAVRSPLPMLTSPSQSLASSLCLVPCKYF